MVDLGLRFRHLLASLLGYDYFISYAHADAGSYGPALAELLAARDLTCFLDRQGLPPGEKLTPGLRLALTRSKALILVATPAARTSTYVQFEVETFVQRGGRILPISKSMASLDHWPTLLDAVVQFESETALKLGRPSGSVVDGVVATFRFTRRAVIRRRIVGAVVTAFFAASLAIAWLGWTTLQQARRTRDALIVAAATNASDPSLQALLLKELDPNRGGPGAAALAVKLLLKGFPRAVLYGHDSAVRKVAPGVDGTFASLGFADAFYWQDSANPISIGGGPISDVTLAPTGSTLAMTINGEGVVLRALAPSGVNATLPVPYEVTKASLKKVFFSADGSAVMATGDVQGERRVVEGWARIWWLAGNLQPADIANHLGHISCTGLSRDGAIAVTAGVFGPTFALRKGSRPEKLTDEGICVAVAQDGSKIAVALTSNEVQLRSTAEIGRPIVVGRLGRHEGPVQALAFSRDGRWLVTGSWDKSARVYDLENPDRIHRMIEATEAVDSVEFDPTGSWVLARASGRVHLFARDDRYVEWVFDGSDAVDAHFSLDGSSVLIACNDGTLRIWPVRRDIQSTPLPAHADRLNVVALSSDQTTMLTATPGGEIKLWQVDDLRHPVLTLNYRSAVMAATFAGGSNRFVIGGHDGSIMVGDRQAAKMTEIGKCSSIVHSLAVNADGTIVAAPCGDEEIRVWSADGDPILSIPAVSSSAIAFDPTGRIVAFSNGLMRSRYGASPDGSRLGCSNIELKVPQPDGLWPVLTANTLLSLDRKMFMCSRLPAKIQ